MVTKLIQSVFIFVIAFIGAFKLHQNTVIATKDATEIEIPITQSSPPCIQMYYALEQFSEENGVPKNYAYGLAFEETRYQGPFDWEYVHSKTSSANAEGPMQIMVPTAALILGKNYDNMSKWERDELRKRLRNDIPFNVEISMKCIKRLHDMYGDWKIAFGYYNTGHPLVNEYAMNVFNFKHQHTKNHD